MPDGRFPHRLAGPGDTLRMPEESSWEDDNSLWAPLIEALVERKRALVVFDLPAHGFSEGEWGLGPQAADGIAAVAAAMGPIDAVVAHSSEPVA